MVERRAFIKNVLFPQAPGLFVVDRSPIAGIHWDGSVF
jgi:hypothetical protein